MMKTIITYGTFDIFHIGHLNLLERTRTLGDKLVVGVSTDAFNRIKGKNTIMSYPDRARIVSSLRCVDGVFPEERWEQKREDIIREQASIFVMGSDWVGHFDGLADLCQVVYLPRTEDISSTEIKNIIRAELRDEFLVIKRQIDSLAAHMTQFVV